MPATRMELFSSINIISLLHPTSTILTSVLFYLAACSAIDDQGQALLTWKNNNLNVSAYALGSWDPAERNPCNWFGVRCDPNGDVIQLSLKSVNLQGSLPANLQPLRFLKTLVLSSANLTGTIPKSIGEHRDLSFIDLSDNSLSGEIPAEICSLAKLQTLHLHSNSLRGRIPAGIGNLSVLSDLTLYDNELSGEIPAAIGALGQLEILRLGGNRNLGGQIPREIGNCSRLVALGLAETSISGDIPASVGKLARIQTIAVYRTLVSGPIPGEIGNCSELQSLYLSQNFISGPIPRSIGELKKLQIILLWQNKLVGAIPHDIGTCTELINADFSDNMLTGGIPESLGNLQNLQILQLSINHLSGSLPSEITSCSSLSELTVYNNDLSGDIPSLIGELKSLTLFYAWNNRLTGTIPETLADCRQLESLDLSGNSLTGSIPGRIFRLQNLTQLLLLSNHLSGLVPQEIGKCTNLYRLRLNRNRLDGVIPSEIGMLRRLTFLDMSNNRFVGAIPPSISGCQSLGFLDLRSNGLSGSFPGELPKSLQFVDVSENRLTGALSPSVGSLVELTKLLLGSNRLVGEIPDEIVSCGRLTLLDFSNNGFSGGIPKELGLLPSLGISLNLSCNHLSGEIPPEFSGLVKLGVLDLSRNNLTGNLSILAGLLNLVSLNVSHNGFSGDLPDTPLFRNLPVSDLVGNPALHISGPTEPAGRARAVVMTKLALSILIGAGAVLVIVALCLWVPARTWFSGRHGSRSRRDRRGGAHWEVTFYHKQDFPMDAVVRSLTSANVIGTGSSGVVYRVGVPDGEILAVKKMWSGDESGAFRNEIRTLGSVRHRNIVRLLGWGSNGSLRLLFYDYLPNGTLSSLLHGAGAGGKVGAEWVARYEVVLGVAHALAYLHHDCAPPIMHGDVKSMNVLLGPQFEPYLADFGLATVVDDSHASKGNHIPQLAGSYGYMAPEHGSMRRITEKSDVYSFGVVLIEVLTGRHPLDPALPGGPHLVQWVREHLSSRRDPAEILDPKLRYGGELEIHEMLQTLAVAVLCAGGRWEERPTMRDVVAMMAEIRRAEAPAPGLPSTKPSPTTDPHGRAMIPHGSPDCSFAFSSPSI